MQPLLPILLFLEPLWMLLPPLHEMRSQRLPELLRQLERPPQPLILLFFSLILLVKD